MRTAPIKSVTRQEETRTNAAISTVTRMTTTQNPATLNIQTIKAHQKATWEAGDFGEVAKYIVPVAEEFMARLNLTSGNRVLDAACGTGNLAILAARKGCAVSGVDIASNLIAQARVRAREEGVDIDYTEGDAESLPYADASFDMVVSMFGVMFAPRPERVVSELKRVTKPGGFIALANWTPRGFIGKMFEVFRRHVATPTGLPSPLQWGDEEMVRERLHTGFVELRLTRCIAHLRYPFDVAGTVEFFRQYYGPTQRAFDSLALEAQAFLRADLEQLQSQYNVSSQMCETNTPAEYLEIRARRAIDG
jgi:2-polyprenyl-3-methyl-5-hydroxy-6-metoxy-1,4-benzoquinol methylase